MILAPLQGAEVLMTNDPGVSLSESLNPRLPSGKPPACCKWRLSETADTEGGCYLGAKNMHIPLGFPLFRTVRFVILGKCDAMRA